MNKKYAINKSHKIYLNPKSKKRIKEQTKYIKKHRILNKFNNKKIINFLLMKLNDYNNKKIYALETINILLTHIDYYYNIYENGAIDIILNTGRTNFGCDEIQNNIIAILMLNNIDERKYINTIDYIFDYCKTVYNIDIFMKFFDVLNESISITKNKDYFLFKFGYNFLFEILERIKKEHGYDDDNIFTKSKNFICNYITSFFDTKKSMVIISTNNSNVIKANIHFFFIFINKLLIDNDNLANYFIKLKDKKYMINLFNFFKMKKGLKTVYILIELISIIYQLSEYSDNYSNQTEMFYEIIKNNVFFFYHFIKLLEKFCDKKNGFGFQCFKKLKNELKNFDIINKLKDCNYYFMEKNDIDNITLFNHSEIFKKVTHFLSN